MTVNKSHALKQHTVSLGISKISTLTPNLTLTLTGTWVTNDDNVVTKDDSGIWGNYLKAKDTLTDLQKIRFSFISDCFHSIINRSICPSFKSVAHSLKTTHGFIRY